MNNKEYIKNTGGFPKAILYVVKEPAGRRIYWKAVSETELSKSILEETQANAGYHPLGYGFDGFKQDLDTTVGPARFIYTWASDSSCD